MRFFKVMMPGFRRKLNLPPAVSKSLRKLKSRKATLRSRIGRWKVSVCDNNLLCFDKGWPVFVKAHALCLGDFLVFQHIADMHFHVCVLDSSTASEKEFPPNPTAVDHQNSYFVKKMLPSHASRIARVSIPVEFVRRNELEQKTKVVLRDPQGREWQVRLLVEDRSSGGVGRRLRMEKGWHDFYVSNFLKAGDTCVFEYVPSSPTSTTLFFNVRI